MLEEKLLWWTLYFTSSVKKEETQRRWSFNPEAFTLKIITEVFVQVGVDEVRPGVAFIQQREPEQPDAGGPGQWGGSADPGPSGRFIT